MATQSSWETFRVEGEGLLEKLKALIREGNIRRVVIKQRGQTIAEFPLTAGVVGAVLAPVLAAVGAIIALLKECTIEVERSTGTHSGEQGDKLAS